MSARTRLQRRNRHALTAIASAAWLLSSAANAYDCSVAAGSTRVMNLGENVPGHQPGLVVCGILLNEVPGGANAINIASLIIQGPQQGGQGVVYNRLGGYMPITDTGLKNNGGTFFNQTGATLDLRGADPGGSAMENAFGATFYNQSGGIVLNAIGTINNQATFINESSNSRVVLDSLRDSYGRIDNKGAGALFDNRDGATLALLGRAGVVNETGASFRNRNGAVVSAAAGTDVTNSSSFENSATAQLRLQGGTFYNTAGGSLNNLSTASIVVSAGGRIINQGAGSSLGNAGGATVTLSGYGADLLNQTGARLTNTGAGSRITIDGGTLRTLAGSGVSNLAGALVEVKSGTISTQSGATWLNDGNGTHLDVNSLSGYYNQGVLTNQNEAFVGIAGIFQNNATGQFQNSAGATVSIAAGTGATGGTTEFVSSGVVSNVGTGTSFSVGNLASFRSTGASAQVSNNGGAQMSVSGTGAIIENTQGSWLTNSGAGSVLAVSLGGSLSNGSQATLNSLAGAQLTVFSGTLTNTANARLINDGAGTKLNLSFGVLDNSASLSNRNGALLDVGSGSTLTNGNSGVISNESGATVKVSGTLSNDGLIQNSAIVTMAGGGQVSGIGSFVQSEAGAVTDISGSWSQGSTQVLAGSFRGAGTVGGAFVNLASVSALGSGLTFAGAVSGNGSFFGATRFNGGVDPGFGIGTMTVTAATLGSSNRLNIEIGGRAQGSGYDALLGGSISLGGTLAVTLVPTGLFGLPLLLQAGDSFDVLSGTSLTGDFSSFDLPTLQAGLGWTHQLVTTGTAFVTTQAYRLTVAAVPEPHTGVMMLAGLAAAGWLTRRRRLPA